MGAERPATQAKTTANQSGELIRVDDTIDGIAQTALALAREHEELARVRRKAGAVAPTLQPGKKNELAQADHADFCAADVSDL